MITFKVTEEFDGCRIDKFLIEQENEILYSRTLIDKLIKGEKIFINSVFCKKKSHKIKVNDRIIVNIDETIKQEQLPPLKENIHLNIIYQDEYIAIINKPAGMTVHPAPGNKNGTLVNALLFHFDELSQSHLFRPGIVHRLDKDTSGLLIITKDNKTHFEMSELFMNRQIEKYYYAICSGAPDPLSGTIDLSIGKSKNSKLKMCVREDGKKAISHYKTLINFEYFSLLEIRIETGRTHQIRVHLDSLNHPIVGDELYSSTIKSLSRCPSYKLSLLKSFLKKLEKKQMLHAYRLCFTHPSTNKKIDISIEMRDEMKKFLKFLKENFEYCEDALPQFNSPPTPPQRGG